MHLYGHFWLIPISFYYLKLIISILADISLWMTSYFKDPDIYMLILIPNIILIISAFFTCQTDKQSHFLSDTNMTAETLHP